MSGMPPVVAVVTETEVTGLRLRLMLEAEGAVVMAGSAESLSLLSPPPRLVLADAASARAVRRWLDLSPVRVPLVVVEDEPAVDWEAVRRRLSALLCEASEGAALAAALARARVLVVDDSVTYREYLRQELQGWGAVVRTAGNASEALAALEREGFDAVIVDLVLPGIDGMELCAEAARLRRGRGLSFALVVISSREGSRDLIRALDAGADEFVGKSADPDLIRARLGALLRRQFLTG